MKWIIRILIVIVVIAGAGYLFREQIILELAGIAAKRQYDVGPHQEIGAGQMPQLSVATISDPTSS